MLSVNGPRRKRLRLRRWSGHVPKGWITLRGCENLFVMSDHGRLPVPATRAHDRDRQRFLRCVAAVTGSRQISWTTLTGPSDHADNPAPRR